MCRLVLTVGTSIDVSLSRVTKAIDTDILFYKSSSVATLILR